ncbi:uncharacterized protein BXZ73DRAFT_55055 [Epithele typhae]|uniref:uncharacterized protein n=1 Tax=Epithele typhae TaxID=378194 RepID=UPI002007C615|nr:uncharacterized protein BXZ73DRAFT_57838 [Epithele typhae]XP_047872576.1 uncharacterized protein BXZ73DRAFT_55055 [Epithele typhae]KAH9910708.1 hypothetical protein BXZ73DRAFT_57838 [Epithele typhae]KAH9914408.1 hypothetical protein BXZ73DRAFT_55055 [Epithele typhae]
MSWVPEPFVGLIKVSLRSDCRYGEHDPFQWPQIFAPEFAFLSVVRHPYPDDHQYAPVWWTPDFKTQFRPVEGCVFKSLGLFVSPVFRKLGSLVDEMQEQVQEHIHSLGSPIPRLAHMATAMAQARDRLRFCPATFRDSLFQLRETQRRWLACCAWIDYSRLTASATGASTVQLGYMGAFCTDPGDAQTLYRAGVPVWFVRPRVGDNLDDVQRIATPLRQPSKLALSPFASDGVPIFSGLSGLRHLQAVCSVKHMYVDVSQAPLLTRFDYRVRPSSEPSASGPVRSLPSSSSHRVSQAKKGSLHPSHLRGRDKFVDKDHAWMPRTLPAWDLAMQSVDRSQPSRPSEELWGYWVPEPSLLVGPTTEQRVARYLMNWLGVHDPWLYLLALPDSPATRVGPQWWRDFLNGDTNAAATTVTNRRTQRLEKVKEVFCRVFLMEDFQERDSGAIEWFHRPITAVDATTGPLILWELFELGFRHELLALDRLLVPMHGVPDADFIREQVLVGVFHHRDLYRLHQLPVFGVGLSHRMPSSRVRCVEALCRVVMRWPQCPSQIVVDPSINAQTVEEMERAVASFYCTTFFTYSGRAPLVPHVFPE